MRPTSWPGSRSSGLRPRSWPAVPEDKRQTIYSPGRSLFGKLTGRPAFEHGYRVANEDQLAQAITHRDLPGLRQGEASLEFKQILDKAKARDRDGRYYTALDFGRAMQRLRGDTVWPYDALHRRGGSRRRFRHQFKFEQPQGGHGQSGQRQTFPQAGIRMADRAEDRLGLAVTQRRPGCRRSHREQQGAPGHAGGSGALGSGLGRTGAGALCFARSRRRQVWKSRDRCGLRTIVQRPAGDRCRVTATNSRLEGPTLSLSRPLTSTSVGLR